MLYLALIIFAIPVLWFVGKMSKPACALAGLIGVVILCAGSAGGSLEAILFGLGLFVFSAFVFLAFNGDKW